MGLFHFLGKVIGGAAKIGAGILKGAASEATGGLSDQVLAKLKGNGNAKLLVAAGMTDSPKAKTLKTEAFINKRMVLPPMDSPPPRADIVKDALRIGKRKSVQFQQAAEEKEALGLIGLGQYAGGGQRAAPRKPRVVAARMLDFRAMSRSWTAANKPVSWQQWIKDFPEYTTANKLTRVVR